jgi:phosphoadenosine phosphosulfate reductase
MNAVTAPDLLEVRIARVRELLAQALAGHAPTALANSLGAEDMVLTDLIARDFPGIEIFTLDTGRLHEETLATLERVRGHYGISVKTYSPRPEQLERYVAANGPNAFYRSVELRKACCAIRKVEPLARALAGKRSWITGLRRRQSAVRGDITEIEHDPTHRLPKFNPLAEWSEQEVWSYIRTNAVPYNPLHDRGFASIGCAPCTRAVTPGEDIRAGRWWWEEETLKECGLHVKQLEKEIRA